MSNINVNTITPVTGSIVSVSGSFHVKNDITMGGTITLGDADTDNVVYTADVSSSILPDVDNTFNLGGVGRRWGTLYATTGSFNNISGSITFQSDVTFQNITATSASISYISSSSPTVFAGGIEPDTSNTHNIGSSTHQWKDLRVRGTAFLNEISASNPSSIQDGVPTISSSVSILPTWDNLYSLGNTARKWKDLYIDGTAHIDTVQAGNLTEVYYGGTSGTVNVYAQATASIFTSASISSIRFENLPDSYAKAATHGSGTLFRSQSVSGGGMHLFVS